MSRMIELNDLDREGHVEVVPVSAVGHTIRSWYGSATALAEDVDTIDELHEALNEQDDEAAREIAAQLGVGFDEAPPTDH